MPEPWSRRDSAYVAASLSAAFVLRVLSASLCAVPGTDAGAYLIGAREIAQGQWKPSLDRGIHPGYLVAVSLAEKALRDPIAGALAVSLVGASLVVLPLYLLARDIAGRRPALLACLFYACLPHFIAEQSDVMTDGMFQALFLTAVTAGWFGVVRDRPAGFALGALFGALAYLTRPEGLFAPASLVGLTLLHAVAARVRRERIPWRQFGFAAVSCIAFAYLTSPLVLWFHHATGSWVPGHRESIDRALQTVGLARDDSPWTSVSPTRDGPTQIGRLAKKAFQASFFLGPVLLVLAWTFRRGAIRPLGALYLIALSIITAAAPLAAAFGGYSFGHRQMLLPLLFFLPLGAHGVIRGIDALAARSTPLKRASVVLLGLLLATMPLQAVHPRRLDDVAIREAGLWLRAEGVRPRVVYSNTTQAWAYAGTRLENLSELPEHLEQLELKQEDRILVDTRRFRERVPGGCEILKRRFAVLARFRQGRPDAADEVLLYGSRGD